MTSFDKPLVLFPEEAMLRWTTVESVVGGIQWCRRWWIANMFLVQVMIPHVCVLRVTSHAACPLRTFRNYVRISKRSGYPIVPFRFLSILSLFGRIHGSSKGYATMRPGFGQQERFGLPPMFVVT